LTIWYLDPASTLLSCRMRSLISSADPDPRTVRRGCDRCRRHRRGGGRAADDTFHAPLPRGPGGHFSFHGPFSNIIPRYSSNQKAAKDFLRWFQSKEIYDQWFASQQGFSVGATKMWENHKMWQEDPVMLPYRSAAQSGRFAGYAGPAGRAAAEAISKYIIVDMYAKAVQGIAPANAVSWATSELQKVYGT
jgi:multiple sugar transport system substrate-binding protein